MSETPKPLTFAEAVDLNAYQLASLWADRTQWAVRQGRADDELAELAVMSALIRWLTGWRPINIHRAILAGATVEQVAAAHGGTVDDAAYAWTQWAEGQRDLREREDRWGITQDEYEQVAAVIGRARNREGNDSQ